MFLLVWLPPHPTICYHNSFLWVKTKLDIECFNKRFMGKCTNCTSQYGFCTIAVNSLAHLHINHRHQRSWACSWISSQLTVSGYVRELVVTLHSQEHFFQITKNSTKVEGEAFLSHSLLQHDEKRLLQRNERIERQSD